jgi:hypothetical protein
MLEGNPLLESPWYDTADNHQYKGAVINPLLF